MPEWVSTTTSTASKVEIEVMASTTATAAAIEEAAEEIIKSTAAAHERIKATFSLALLGLVLSNSLSSMLVVNFPLLRV